MALQCISICDIPESILEITMSEHITPVTEVNFEADVLQSVLPVLVDFWAPWCGPCLGLMPTVEAIAPIYAGQLKVVKINCDDAKALADRYGVRGIPHLVLIKNGEQAAVLSGRTKTRLSIELDKLLS
jgi:thioredoxin 1